MGTVSLEVSFAQIRENRTYSSVPDEKPCAPDDEVSFAPQHVGQSNPRGPPRWYETGR